MYASVSVDMKAMQSRLESNIRATVIQAVAEYMMSKDTLGDVVKDIDGYASSCTCCDQPRKGGRLLICI